MTAREYYGAVLQRLTTSTVVTSQQIEFDEQDVYVAYLKGSVTLVDGSTVFFAQYVQIEGTDRSQITGTSGKPRRSGRGYKAGCWSGSMP